MSKNISKAEEIIKNLINLVGITAGIIIVSIGSIIFLESIFKLYIFDLKQDRYDNFSYRCEQFDIDSIEANRLLGGRGSVVPEVGFNPTKNNEKVKKLTEEEKTFLRKKYQECKDEAAREAQINFQRNEKMDIAEGIAFMFVGFMLLFFYHRNRKKRG